VTVRCQTAEGGPDVGAQVVLAMAARAGIPPLAADRLRGDVRDALRAAQGVVELTCSADEHGITVAISSPDGSLEPLRAALDGFDAEVAGGSVRVHVRRTPLRPV
jgi:hypothetical protein